MYYDTDENKELAEHLVNPIANAVGYYYSSCTNQLFCEDKERNIIFNLDYPDFNSSFKKLFSKKIATNSKKIEKRLAKSNQLIKQLPQSHPADSQLKTLCQISIVINIIFMSMGMYLTYKQTKLTKKEMA